MTAPVLRPLLLVVGVALMIPFEGAVTRVLGIACLVGFVVWGVFLIASPDNARQDEPRRRPATPEGVAASVARGPITERMPRRTIGQGTQRRRA